MAHQKREAERAPDGLPDYRLYRQGRGVELRQGGLEPAVVGALRRTAAEERHAMHMESEGLDDGRRECVERGGTLRHRSAEGEPLDRALDWSGTADARRGARTAHPTGSPLRPKGVRVGQARQARHRLCGRHRTARVPHQRRLLQCQRPDAHAYGLPQDGALQHLRHHGRTEGEELHRTGTGQRSAVPHAPEQALQGTGLRTAEVSHQHPHRVYRRHHQAYLNRREMEDNGQWSYPLEQRIRR